MLRRSRKACKLQVETKKSTLPINTDQGMLDFQSMENLPRIHLNLKDLVNDQMTLMAAII